MEVTEDEQEQRLEVLREIPPLMPLFLQRRRAALPEVREAVERLTSELGVERPVFFVLVGLHELQGSYDWEPVSMGQVIARQPYRTIDTFTAPVRVLQERGLVERYEHDRFLLTARARTAVDGMHAEARGHLGRTAPLPAEHLERLAAELERARDAILRDPVLALRQGSHLAGSHSLARGIGPGAPPMVRIEQAVFDLWMARDDAHISAWENAGLQGPAMSVLSVLWQDPVHTISELQAALAADQDPAGVEANLAYLVENEYATQDGDEVALTPAGVLVREDIERETDRVYFAPWPQTAAEVRWVRDMLKGLVEAIGRG